MIKLSLRRSLLALALGVSAVVTLAVAPTKTFAQNITGTDPCPKGGCVAGSGSAYSVATITALQVGLVLVGAQ